MATTAQPGTDTSAIEMLLRDDLTHADQVMVHMGPILRHLLQNDDSSIFSDEIIARVRGMLADIARQLIEAIDKASDLGSPLAGKAEPAARLAEMLGGSQALLHHLHMLAVEWQLTEKLRVRIGLDPVLTPLLQDLIASADPDVAARGINLLAAQARFGQCMRRMQIPLSELPRDLHHIAMMTMQALIADDAAGLAVAGTAQAALRQNRSTSVSRLDLLDHLTRQLGGDIPLALSPDRAGVALFLTALAFGASVSREMATMCTTESQMARLALALCAAGSGRSGLLGAFSVIHPDVALPEAVESIVPDRAAAILASSLSSNGALA
ncbi:hypothetical protein [Novosphingobium jiangmenense]|uniref:DUF2336 domain-containing protein n=1 Tax=Novosphingobium jiangmenense TaxID=2791981 RepID=A0ABS0HCY6_9SPHN|nr:hypothetical protein [Novosphingobium jiangmenense]MBF9150087.1 hypothetical protein [Novosphingobium jiangmenense]